MIARCRACQLQLCKSREERPHADLKAVVDGSIEAKDSAIKGRDTAYTCQKCGTGLVNSTDKTEPGWRKLAA
ncbi:MAG: hypothetical protein EXR11_12275 [Rhodospirillaceae bacterium]|nr:hypothetical protein [Rhodospirillaceae bacterium]